MNAYTPDMFPSLNRIVPHDEGRARLAQIREHVAAGEDAVAVARQVGSNIWMNHDPGIDGKCRRCSFQYPKLNLTP